MSSNVSEIGVITILHALAAVSPHRAVSPTDIAFYLKAEEKSVLTVLKKLLEEGYVKEVEGRFYLTMKGRLKVLSLYT